MTERRVAILGGGKMGEALLSGLLRSGRSPDEIMVTARREERAAELAETYGVQTALDNQEAVAWTKVLVLAVKPQDSFHVVDIAQDGRVTGLVPVADMSMVINGGYFVLRQGIFDYLEEGDDLVTQACVRAAQAGRLLAIPYDGFWRPMDTLKERASLEALYWSGECPWALWRNAPHGAVPAPEPVDVPVPAPRLVATT